jgi:hypothetical protein
MQDADNYRRNRAREYVTVAAASVAILFGFGSTSAMADYIGPSYFQIPGIDGGAKFPKYKGWVRSEADYWRKQPGPREIRGVASDVPSLLFTAARAPARGPNDYFVAVEKSSLSMAALMAKCQSGEAIPSVKVAESSEMERHPQERGPRPADVPEYYEFELQNVHISCPVVANAPEQAFGMHFDQINWLNFKPQPKPIPITAEPAKIIPAPKSGDTKVFLVSWMSAVADSTPDQCPKLNEKPSEADYLALMPKEKADEVRAKAASQGGVSPFLYAYRGPDQMNAIMLPGIVPDPGFYEPAVNVVQGFNLDNNDGTGAPPKGIARHANFVSPDGQRGIDNQLFRVLGCVTGWKHDGFLPLIANEQRRAGSLSVLLEISGINNMKNDNDVTVALVYSRDSTKRDGTSKIVLPDYTFRVTDDPSFTQDFLRFHGKIVNGVLTTDILPKIVVRESTNGIAWSLAKARLRIKFNPDGTISALMGGYRDWREFLAGAFFQQAAYENTVNFQAPAMYDAIRRAADGLQDRYTGEYDGISTAETIEGVPAFIPPGEVTQLAKGGAYHRPASELPQLAAAAPNAAAALGAAGGMSRRPAAPSP